MYAVTDIETTGLDPWKNEILTICVILADDDFNEVDRFEGKIKPKYLNWWSDDAEKVHGISKDEALAFDSSADVANGLIGFLDKHCSSGSYSFVCHALSFTGSPGLFDYKFIFSWFWSHDHRAELYGFFPEERIISTIDRKRLEAQKKYSIENQKLATWMDKLNIDNTKHHDASFDAEVCLQILKYQRGETWSQKQEQLQQEKKLQQSQQELEQEKSQPFKLL